MSRTWRSRIPSRSTRSTSPRRTFWSSSSSGEVRSLRTPYASPTRPAARTLPLPPLLPRLRKTAQRGHLSPLASNFRTRSFVPSPPRPGSNPSRAGSNRTRNCRLPTANPSRALRRLGSPSLARPRARRTAQHTIPILSRSRPSAPRAAPLRTRSPPAPFGLLPQLQHLPLTFCHHHPWPLASWERTPACTAWAGILPTCYLH